MGASTSKALEVGPGSGIYLPLLAELFEKVTAVDVEPGYLRQAESIAKKFPNVAVIADDITNSKLPEGSFDLILSSEVVEHIADSPRVFMEMHRLLRRGGTLILSTPQRWSPLEVLAKIAFLPGVIWLVRQIYREPIRKTGHINLMTSGQVQTQLTQARFCILERFSSGLYLPLVAEFIGQFGLRLEQRLETKTRESLFDWLLWTQYYVAEA